MRFDRLDLNLLVALDALIEERSVSTAAKRLFLSQPAISGALNRIRDYFGDEILVPSGRQMMLTPKAEELRGPVRDALMLIRSRITTPLRFDPTTAERHFTIAASDYAYSVFVSKVIVKAAGIAPNVSFEAIPTGVTAQERFDRGEVDLMITIDTLLAENHPHAAMFDDSHAVICWSEGIHRAGITESSFFDADHAVVVFGADRHPAFTETYFAQQGISRRIQVCVPFFSALPSAIVGTNRVATMYRRHAEYFAEHLPITIHEPPVPMPRVREDAQWHSFRASDEGLKWLLGLAREVGAEMGGVLAAN